jgi:hypothetical protein
MDEQGSAPPPSSRACGAAPPVGYAHEAPADDRPHSRIGRWLLQGLHHDAVVPVFAPRVWIEDPGRRPRIHVG